MHFDIVSTSAIWHYKLYACLNKDYKFTIRMICDSVPTREQVEDFMNELG